MLKSLIVLMFSLFLMVSFTGCSSSSEVDGENPEAASVEDGEEEDLAEGDEEEMDESEDEDEYLAEEEGEEEDDLGDGSLDPEEQLDEEGAEEMAGEEGSDEPMDEMVMEEEGSDEPMDEMASEDGMANDQAGMDEATPEGGDVADSSEEMATSEYPDEGMAEATDEGGVDYAEGVEGEDSGEALGDAGVDMAPLGYVPVKKMADAPFRKNGVLVNAIYIARDGDTAESISQKVLGREDAEAIYSVNTTLRRGIKVGDKIYYNSPNRPDDSSKLLTFYEDQGLAPEVYVSKPGDNIRVVAKQMLGNDRSWMEFYATNLDVDSKGELPEGTQLRYWASTEVAQSSAPMNSAPPAPADIGGGMDDLPPPPPADTASNDLPPPPPDMGAGAEDLPPPPPPMDTASNDIPPPPPAPDMGGGDIPPPPPAMGSTDDGIAPPPPPVAAPAAKKPSKKVASADNQDQTMMMGIAGILALAAVLLFIVMKKKRGKQEIDFNTATQTQID